jgi:hypothetical protein
VNLLHFFPLMASALGAAYTPGRARRRCRAAAHAGNGTGHCKGHGRVSGPL